MDATADMPTADLPKSNPYNGFYLMKSSHQDELLKSQYGQGLLCLDPRKGFAIISVSGRNQGMMLNPTNSNGLLLFFVDLNLAKQFVEARKTWFEEKHMPVDDVGIGKWCFSEHCSCQKD